MVRHSTVTDWLGQLRNGDDVAAGKLWNHFLQRLTSLVSIRLKSVQKTISDEEDVVLDACEACFRVLKEGRYPRICNRNDLWRLLTVIAERKAIDQIRKSNKGVDGKRENVSFHTLDRNSSIWDGMQQLPCSEPTPEFAAIFAEDLMAQLEKLKEKYLQETALMKMKGYSNQEIANELGRSVSSVERYLKLIREIWKNG